MKVRITAAARRDLDGIWQYTNHHWGAVQADRYIDSLITRILWLTKNDNLWRLREDLGSGILTQNEGSHLIVFSSDRQKLNILRILHSRMDIGRHLD